MDIPHHQHQLSSKLLEYLNCSTPIVETACFTATYIYSSWRQPCSARYHSAAKVKSRLAIYLLGVIAAVSIVQSSICIYASIQDAAGFSSHGKILHAHMETILWTPLWLVQLSSSSLAWLPFTLTWTIAAVLETTVTSLQSFTLSELEPISIVNLGLEVVANVGLIALSLTGISVLLYFNTSALLEDENQPLLGHDYGQGGSGDSESEAEDLPVIKKRQQQLLERKQEGGWFGYAREYLIFWPYIWPSGNVKLQAYFWLLIGITLAERALNVLQPRQFGIVVDKLYSATTRGVEKAEVPWKEILLWILYAVSASALLPMLNRLLESRISNWSHFQLSIAAFEHVMSLPMSFHDSKDSGEVIKAVEQANSLNSVLRILLLEMSPLMLDLIIACWYITYLLDVYATLIVITVIIAFCFITYHMSIIVKQARRLSAACQRGESQILYEKISNWATVSYFNRLTHEQGNLADAVGKSVKAKQWSDDAATYMFGARQVYEFFGLLMLSLLAAYRVVVSKEIPVANFVTLQSYWTTITAPMWKLAHSYRQILSHLVDAERLLQLFKRTSSIQDGPVVLPADSPGKIEFEGVGFRYTNNDSGHESDGKGDGDGEDGGNSGSQASRTILSDISFTVQPGQTVALVGETGSGKSTIVKLLMRFYDVTSGSIKVDGHDIRTLTLDSLRRMFGLVPQTPVLFNTSILENVRYGKLDATEEEVHNACRAAALHEKILTFGSSSHSTAAAPAAQHAHVSGSESGGGTDGYYTEVGERGVKLSGGEMQRLAIARVMLKDPQIVLLDEATSALDTGTEAKVQQALGQLTVASASAPAPAPAPAPAKPEAGAPPEAENAKQKGKTKKKKKTTIVIAHRLSTVVNADLILVLDKNGRIVERGTHEQLLRLKGRYVEHWGKSIRLV